MSSEERKAALDLFPYFSKEPVIFDVGSNKGEWTDLFVDRVANVHLFEPNELLLHYTMVKFCDRENVTYCNSAITDKNGTITLDCFTNVNNGLSNIFGNPKWNYLPSQKKEVQTTTLDQHCLFFKIKHIDFLKVDVEGAEMLVLQGAEKLLQDKKIRFIQVEKAEHINLSGYTFEDLENYLKTFGYVPMETADTENVIFMQEGFTQDWNGEFKKNTVGIKADFALEVGCFEGLTTNYICENLLNSGGRIVCIDPLTDEYLPGHEDNAMFVGQYERFTRNTCKYPVELIREKSIDAYPKIKDYRFDFIYIDGDHTENATENAVFLDALNCFTLCKVGGYILFDDYEWREETKRGIDRFLSVYQHKIEVVIKGYQVLVLKKENL
jgi:FkbM family methyltransferase